jgi:nicotinamidase-related amidase
MLATSLDPRTALVLIDLQNGILAMPTVTARGRDPQAGRPARPGFPGQGAAGHLRPGRTEPAPPAAFSELPAELGVQDGDIVITKRHWGAFTGTGLDLKLRRRGDTQIVLAGISTSIGMESTARPAYEFVEDATTDTNAEGHANSIKKFFRRLAEVDTADRVIELLAD